MEKKKLEEELEEILSKEPEKSTKKEKEKITKELIEKIKEFQKKGEETNFREVLRKVKKASPNLGNLIQERVEPQIRIVLPQREPEDRNDKEDIKYSGVKYVEGDRDKNYMEAPKVGFDPEIMRTREMNQDKIGRSREMFQTEANFRNPESERIQGKRLEQDYVTTKKIDPTEAGKEKNNPFSIEEKEYIVR